MNKIKLNNTEFEITSYTRNTSFGGDTISMTAYCDVASAANVDVYALGQDTITSIQIYHDDTLIYDLQDISAHIDSSSEYLNVDHMSLNIIITFDIEENL